MQDSENLTWEEAIRRVLIASPDPLNADQIIHAISENGLRKLGAAPKQSVWGRLSLMATEGKIERPNTGFYQISTGSGTPVSAEAIAETKEEAKIAEIAAYGLYWERDKVNWNPGQGGRFQLLGTPEASDGEVQINFADQWGIYLLHNQMDVMYVGRTTDSLLGRLRGHSNNERRNARWDRFSWFGFRRVDEDTGTLSDEIATIDIRMMITILETVMIEAFIPPLNDKGGDLKGTLYRQVEDPILVEERETEFRRMVARAIDP